MEILEYPKVLERVSSFAFLEETENSMAIPAFPPRDEVEHIFSCTEEASELLQSAGTPPLDSLPPLLPLLDEAAPEGALLSMEQLRSAALWGKTGSDVGNWISGSELKLPLLFSGLSSECRVPGHFHKNVLKYISPEGEIDDRADPELRDIRNKIRKASAQLNKSLSSMLHAPAHSDSFQDRIVTLREGRYVLPVRAGKKGRVEGIVHGKSSSGETIYIEPSMAVEQNNHLTSLHMEEKRIISRILMNFTTMLRHNSEEYSRMHRSLLTVDSFCARARFAKSIRGTRPIFSGNLHLKNARHPLLQVTPVPVEINFLNRSMMLITGPNTGGKTVSLKTAGLLSMMALGGYHIPAEEGSSLPFFREIHCDIGDEQSINKNLSTFSGHMFNLKQIITESTARDLVLIDEPGAGTDPSEGAALARAILEFLLDRGTRVMATTHFNELKYYAHENDMIISASVAFDRESLKPLYHLLPGIPGSSHALQIAANLQIPETVIHRAKALLGSDALNIESILSSLQSRLSEAEKFKIEAELKNRELASLKKEYELKMASISSRRDTMIRETREELAESVRLFRSDSDAFIRELKQRRQPLDAKTESGLKEKRNRLGETALNHIPEPESTEEPKITPMEGEPQPGDLVLIETMGKKGRVLEIKNRGKKILVQLGNTRTLVPAASVIRIQGPAEQKIRSSVETISRQTTTTLDIRGKRYEEARELVRSFIDDCSTGGISRATVIHGKGSGSLQRATKEILDTHPCISEYDFSPLESGGSGSTIIQLK